MLMIIPVNIRNDLSRKGTKGREKEVVSRSVAKHSQVKLQVLPANTRTINSDLHQYSQNGESSAGVAYPSPHPGTPSHAEYGGQSGKQIVGEGKSIRPASPIHQQSPQPPLDIAAFDALSLLTPEREEGAEFPPTPSRSGAKFVAAQTNPNLPKSTQQRFCVNRRRVSNRRTFPHFSAPATASSSVEYFGNNIAGSFGHRP
ncbi:hypothetical protein BJ322DRAFT_1022028 [Thelephora terrestris]|uniref:Uncharacterized protein n=1 Tax=Thelephora terrestris TaxID=56493 RepID=A0A9P6HB36_9AGAM|nr:hypothetical protein BJ322DRAFT_1022028 [Thelephora terrestris]